MKALKRALVGVLFLAASLCAPALAQQVAPITGPPQGIDCAYNSSLPTLTSGFQGWVQCDSQGKLYVDASVSASITGFQPASVGTPISVTTAGVTGTLPAGAVVVATNVGANGAYCALGASSTTAQQYLGPSGGWFSFTVGSATQLTCITSTSTTTVNMVGGSGLASGVAGAGAATIGGTVSVQGTGTAGSAAGGILTVQGAASMTPLLATVSQGTAANLNATVVGTGTFATQSAITAASGSIASGALASGAGVDGWNVTEGTKADTAWASGSGSIVALLKATATSAGTIATNTGNPTPTQNPAVPIGGMSLCDGANGSTNPCTTAATVLAASTAGAATNKSLSVSINPGEATAGTPAGAILTIQGVASMTPLLANPGTAANWGVGATGSAIPANAASQGVDAQSAEPSKATTGNLTPVFGDLTGKIVTSPYANRENYTRGAGSSTSTAAITILPASGSASLKEYATAVQCGRTDAGTSAIYVTLNDSASTVLVLPNNGGGGGNNPPLQVPLVVAANTAMTATPSAGVSTVYCSAQGYNGY